MNFREIIELARKRGLETGKASKVDIIAAIESGRMVRRADIIHEVRADYRAMKPADTAEPLGKN